MLCNFIDDETNSKNNHWGSLFVVLGALDDQSRVWHVKMLISSQEDIDVELRRGSGRSIYVFYFSRVDTCDFENV